MLRYSKHSGPFFSNLERAGNVEAADLDDGTFEARVEKSDRPITKFVVFDQEAADVLRPFVIYV